MKNKSKLIAATVLLSTVAGGALLASTSLSLAGLKDDSCWDPKQVTIRDQIHSRNCTSFGRVEPNNRDRGKADTFGNIGGGTKQAASPPAASPPASPPPTPEGTPSSPPPGPSSPPDCVTDCGGGGSPPPPPAPPPPPPPTKKKNNGFGNSDEGGCTGSACTDPTNPATIKGVSKGRPSR